MSPKKIEVGKVYLAKGKRRAYRRVLEIEEVERHPDDERGGTASVVRYECVPMGCKHRLCLGTFAGWVGLEVTDDIT